MIMDLITVHTLDGREVFVNTHNIVSVAVPREAGTMNDDARCVLTTTDGKYITVRERCTEVMKKILGQDYDGK